MRSWSPCSTRSVRMNYTHWILHHLDTPGVVQPNRRVLQPVPLGNFVALALTFGFSIHGSQSKATKFLGGQVRRCLSGGLISNPNPECADGSFICSYKWKPSSTPSFFLVPLRIFPTRTRCTPHCCPCCPRVNPPLTSRSRKRKGFSILPGSRLC